MSGFSKHDISRILHDFRCKLKKDIECCLAGIGDTLNAILEAILNQTAENENNLKCSMNKACNPDCEVVICHTCYDTEGQITSTSHTLPDGSPYEGDPLELDLGCTACGDPIPSYEIINIPVCFEDCTTGYNLIKINTIDDSVTLVGTFDIAGIPSTKTITECPEIKVVEQTKCEI